MSEYRSALRAARERIEQLEASLPLREPTRVTRVSARRLLLLLAITLPTFFLLTLVVSAVRLRWPRAQTIQTLPALPPAPSPPLPPRDGLEWLAQTWFAPTLGGPLVTEEDGTGSRALVGLAWDRARDEDGMFAVGYDYKTLAERWRAGPYPSFRTRDGAQLQYLALVGTHVVVTDRRGGVHVLDPSNGEERHVYQLRNAPFKACVTGSGAAARLILPLDGGYSASSPHDNTIGSLFPWEINHLTVALDPATGRTTQPPPFSACPDDHYCMWKHVDGCRDLDQRDHPPQGKLTLTLQEVWSWNDDRVGLGALRRPDGRMNDNAPVAIGWDAPTRTVRWESRLTTLEHPLVVGTPTWGALGKNGFFFLYRTSEGASRLVGRDSLTGAARFDVEVPGSALGTRVHDLNARADDALVSLNEELLVFDGATGTLRGRLGAGR